MTADRTGARLTARATARVNPLKTLDFARPHGQTASRVRTRAHTSALALALFTCAGYRARIGAPDACGRAKRIRIRHLARAVRRAVSRAPVRSRARGWVHAHLS